jgi:hypothetical protein
MEGLVDADIGGVAEAEIVAVDYQESCVRRISQALRE